MGQHCSCLPLDARWTALEESVRLAREADSPWLLAASIVMAYAGSFSVGKSSAFKLAVLDEAVGIARTIGDSDLMYETIHGKADVFLYLGEYETARDWFLEAKRLAHERNDRFQVFEALFHLVTISLALGEHSSAKAECIDALHLCVELNMRFYIPRLFYDMAEISISEGSRKRAARLHAASAQYGRPTAVFEPQSFQRLGLTAEEAGAAWLAAKSMDIDELVSYALADAE